MTSLSAKQPIDDLIISSILRSGLRSLTRILSNQYAPDGITVNSVLPEFILTKRQEEIFRARAKTSGQSSQALTNIFVQTIPALRLDSPEEVGGLVTFLASERAGYITGVAIATGGGLSKGIL